jgi:hypothetical protein
MKKSQSRPAKPRRNILLKRDQLLPFRGSLDYLASRLPGGRSAFMDMLNLACELDPRLLPITQAWADIRKRDRREVSIDSLCETAAPTLSIAKIAGLVVEASMSWGLNVSNLIAALNHPRVVEASIRRALTERGVHDRRMQFLHSGFLRSEGGRGGAVFNVSAHAEAETQAFAGAKVVTPGLPPFEQETLERAALIRDLETTEPSKDPVE